MVRSVAFRLGLDRAADALNLTVNATLVLGRSISILPARRLVTSGPMPFVRHPLYLAEIVALAGVALEYWSVWALSLGIGLRLSTSAHDLRGAGAV